MHVAPKPSNPYSLKMAASRNKATKKKPLLSGSRNQDWNSSRAAEEDYDHEVCDAQRKSGRNHTGVTAALDCHPGGPGSTIAGRNVTVKKFNDDDDNFNGDDINEIFTVNNVSVNFNDNSNIVSNLNPPQKQHKEANWPSLSALVFFASLTSFVSGQVLSATNTIMNFVAVEFDVCRGDAEATGGDGAKNEAVVPPLVGHQRDSDHVHSSGIRFINRGIHSSSSGSAGSATFPPPGFHYRQIGCQTQKSYEQISLALLFIGCAFGSYTSGILCDKWGRVTTMVRCSMAGIVVFVVTGFSVNWSMFIVMRGIGGLLLAAISTPVAIYVSEIIPKEHRGKCVASHQLMKCLGGFAAMAIGLPQTQDIDWKNSERRVLVDGLYGEQNDTTEIQNGHDRSNDSNADTDSSTVTINDVRIYNEAFSHAENTQFLPPFVSHLDQWWWRFSLSSPAIPCLVVVFAFTCLFKDYESPSWLLQKGRREDALRVAQKLGIEIQGSSEVAPSRNDNANDNLNTNSSEGMERRSENQQNLKLNSDQQGENLKSDQKTAWWAVRHPYYRRGVLLGGFLAFFQMTTGIYFFIAQSSQLFETVFKNSPGFVSIMTCLLGLAFSVITFLSALVVDRVGRRFLLLLSASGCVLSMVVGLVGVCLERRSLDGDGSVDLLEAAETVKQNSLESGNSNPNINNPNHDTDSTDANNLNDKFNSTSATSASDASAFTLPNILSAVSNLAFVISYACGWGGAVFIYLAEIYPSEIRSSCFAMANVVAWLTSGALVFGLGLVIGGGEVEVGKSSDDANGAQGGDTNDGAQDGDMNISNNNDHVPANNDRVLIGYIIFLGFNIMSFAFVYFFVVETKNTDIEKSPIYGGRRKSGGNHNASRGGSSLRSNISKRSTSVGRVKKKTAKSMEMTEFEKIPKGRAQVHC